MQYINFTYRSLHSHFRFILLLQSVHLALGLCTGGASLASSDSDGDGAGGGGVPFPPASQLSPSASFAPPDSPYPFPHKRRRLGGAPPGGIPAADNSLAATPGAPGGGDPDSPPGGGGMQDSKGSTPVEPKRRVPRRAMAERGGGIGAAMANGLVVTNGTSNGEVGPHGDGGEGESEGSIYPIKLMSRADKNIVRLIGQHLQHLGLKWVNLRMRICDYYMYTYWVEIFSMN